MCVCGRGKNIKRNACTLKQHKKNKTSHLHTPPPPPKKKPQLTTQEQQPPRWQSGGRRRRKRAAPTRPGSKRWWWEGRPEAVASSARCRPATHRRAMTSVRLGRRSVAPRFAGAHRHPGPVSEPPRQAPRHRDGARCGPRDAVPSAIQAALPPDRSAAATPTKGGWLPQSQPVS